jgi:predicted nucleic acid-binding protein
MSARPFLDTNVLIYAFTTGDPRSVRAEALIAEGGTVSVQVLNEFVNVFRRKLRRSWQDTENALRALATLLDAPLPLTMDLHRTAVRLSRDHALAFYDSLIIAAAIVAGCNTLYSEDMQGGCKIGGVTIRNPFSAR